MGSLFLFRLGWLRGRHWWRRGLRLLNLQIIDYGFDAVDGGGIAGCRSPLGIAIDVAAEGHDAAGSLNADLPALNSGIAIDPGLNVGCDLGVGASFFF